MPETTDAMVQERRSKLWVQIVLVFLLAVVTQFIGLIFAYVERCKPGQGNDFCGAGSLAGVVIGFVAAVIVMVAGLTVVLLRRKRAGGGSGASAGRLAAAALGAILLVPCAWMIAGGWPRNNSNFGLWFGIVLGLVIMGAAFVRRRQK